jgi:hypothetical protein
MHPRFDRYTGCAIAQVHESSVAVHGLRSVCDLANVNVAACNGSNTTVEILRVFVNWQRKPCNSQFDPLAVGLAPKTRCWANWYT